MVFICSCSKDTPAPTTVVDVCPNTPGIQTSLSQCIDPIPAPTGTVVTVPSNQSIEYDSTVKFYCYFQNTTAVYANGVYVGKDTFQYTTAKLKADSSFTFSATGPGGTKTIPVISIHVGVDPRINFLILGMYRPSSSFYRVIGNPNGPWLSTSISPMDSVVYTYQGINGIPPGSSGATGNLATAKYNGTPITIHWYFTGQSGFESNGVSYHLWQQTGASSFEIYSYGTLIIIGQGSVPIEFKDGFLRQ